MRLLVKTAVTAVVTILATTFAAADPDHIRARRGDDGPNAISRVLFPLENNDRLLPERISAVGPGGGYAAELPERAEIVDFNRVDLSGIPLIGQVFDKPQAALLRDEDRVGVVLEAERGLAVALSPSIDAARAAELLRRPIILITKTPRRNNLVALSLPAMAPGEASRPGGAPIGGVYDGGDALVIAPPRDLFYGLEPLFD